jgi:hypothetical protein
MANLFQILNQYFSVKHSKKRFIQEDLLHVTINARILDTPVYAEKYFPTDSSSFIAAIHGSITKRCISNFVG